jgi:hypothetical protein
MQPYQIEQFVYKLRSMANDGDNVARQSFVVNVPGLPPKEFTRAEAALPDVELHALVEQRAAG